MKPRTWVIETADQLERLCSFLPKLDLPLEVTAGEPTRQRTVSQNARLWKLHTLAADVTGYTPEEMHEEALCHHFGFTEKPVKCLITGRTESKRVPLKRSSARDTKEFAEFMSATENWYARELGVWLGD